MVISYHVGDAFTTSDVTTRYNYYGVGGTPTMFFDGIVSEVGGTSFPGNSYSALEPKYEQRISIPSLFEINLDCVYDSVANTGTVTASILNTDISDISGTLQFAVVESHRPYNWGGMTELNFMMRDMLPDASGEAVTIPAGDTILRERSFSINSSWNEYNCRIVVFVQGITKEIYQGAEIGVIPEPNMTYYGLAISETNGNGNLIPEPGESIELKIAAKNMGTGNYDGAPSILCTDPYIRFTSIAPYTVSTAPGAVDTVINLAFDIDPSCPDPHTIAFEIEFGSSVDSIPFVIATKPGLSDDIESGQGDWTHFGPRDYWHITEHSSNSPTHSWYCGMENSWIYSVNNDASLATPYFVAPPDSPLYFYHRYSLETNWDYCYVDIDNGSGYWQTLDIFNGTQSSWTQASYPLSSYVGQTIRIRFRFMCDLSGNFEGWYIDDISVPTLIGVSEFSNPTPATMNLSIYPNPFKQMTKISYTTTDNRSPVTDNITQMKIYDASGRLIRSFNNLTNYQSPIHWSGDDDFGRKVPAGIYFVELQDIQQSLVQKVVLLR